MSGCYSYQIYLHPQSEFGDPESWVPLIALGSRGRGHVDVVDRDVILRASDWRLRFSLVAEPWVREEAAELAEYHGDVLDDGVRAELRRCAARIEVSATPEDKTDDHYNTWLSVREVIAEQNGMLVYDPAEGAIEGEQTFT